MDSLWDDLDAAKFTGALGPRVYTSRLLGRDRTLVMHGGGNTSVKLRQRNILNRDEEILCVKGSGWDLETIERAGFSPCRLSVLLELAQLPELSDVAMVNELRQAMTLATAPVPSVEAILHALLPHKYVDHTHADAIIAISNTRDGAARFQEIYGDRVLLVPYVMPGFKLARLLAQTFPQSVHAGTEGIILLNHGIFTFGEDARESYERMIALTSEAEQYLKREKAFHLDSAPVQAREKLHPAEIAAFRREISAAAGRPMIVAMHQDDEALHFARRTDVAQLAGQGPLTPDHVLRTKQFPLIGRDVTAYGQTYRGYFERHASRSSDSLKMLDPAPRLVLDPEWGLLAIGKTAKDAAVAEEIYRHTIDVILRATALGGYQALPAKDVFDVEYWELEQAKLRNGGPAAPFTGEIALVTGAASGIGKACVNALLAKGAAVVGLDIDGAVESAFTGASWLGIRADVTDESAIRSAMEATARQFGGLDMLVLNAGIFSSGASIETLALEQWDRVMRINLDANMVLMREAYPFLKLATRPGRVVIVGSKNVAAPGPGAAAYSASKAALTQLARVAALEWGADRIRVNVVHPNAVFDTALWTPEVIEERAARYHLSVADYKTNNVLKVEVTSDAVGEVVATLCSDVFNCTTGAQIPVDGGNERVI